LTTKTDFHTTINVRHKLRPFRDNVDNTLFDNDDIFVACEWCVQESNSKFERKRVTDMPKSKTRSSADIMLTNPRDTFSGQSRSPNIVPFHVRYSFLLVWNS